MKSSINLARGSQLVNGAADMYNFRYTQKAWGYWLLVSSGYRDETYCLGRGRGKPREGPLWESERGRGTRAEECVRRSPPHGHGRRTFRLCSYR